MTEKKSSRILTCEITPADVLNFTYENPFGTDVTDVSLIKGSQSPDGSLTGEQQGVDNTGRSYTIHAGEGTLAGNDLERDTLPRVAQRCREALKP